MSWSFFTSYYKLKCLFVCNVSIFLFILFIFLRISSSIQHHPSLQILVFFCKNWKSGSCLSLVSIPAVLWFPWHHDKYCFKAGKGRKEDLHSSDIDRQQWTWRFTLHSGFSLEDTCFTAVDSWDSEQHFLVVSEISWFAEKFPDFP